MKDVYAIGDGTSVLNGSDTTILSSFIVQCSKSLSKYPHVETTDESELQNGEKGFQLPKLPISINHANVC